MNASILYMRLFNLVILFITLPSGVFAQSSIIDSLNDELSRAKHDTARINILIDLAYEQADKEQLKTALKAYELASNLHYQKFKGRTEAILGLFYSSYDLDSGIALLSKGANRYLVNDMTERSANAFLLKGVTYEEANEWDLAILSYEQALEVAEINNHIEEIAESSSSLAAIYNTRGENVKALKNGLKSKEAYEKLGLRLETGQSLNQIGIIYDQKGLYAEALDSYLRALDIAVESMDIVSEIRTSNNLGVIYDNMNDIEKAQQYYSTALEKANIHDMAESEATLLNNLSYIYLKRGDTTQSLTLLKKALKIDLSNIYPCFESYPMEGLGSIYVAKGRLDSASYYLQKALKNAAECEDAEVLSAVNQNLGIMYFKRGDLKKAVTFLDKSLEISTQAGLVTKVQEALLELYKFHKATGNSTKAMSYLEKYQVKMDSLYEANNIEKATQLAAEYAFRKQIEIMEAERQAADLKYIEELQSKKRENSFFLIALILSALLAISLGRSYYVIQKNNKKLKWLNEEKNTLMGVVAHDLRNPLNMIKSLMDLIKDTRPTDRNTEDEHYLDLVTQSTDKMRDMIDRVLDISAVENMKVNLNLERRNLAYLVLKASENFRQIANQKKIEIHNDFDLKSEFHSNVDPNYFDQVMDNLLSNAIKFSEMGKKIILKIEQDGSNNIISVSDEGPGIGEDEKEKLFTKFTKLAAKPTSNEQSVGLGLSIVQKFVKAMNGEINCESQVGVGTTFSLKFKEA